MSCGRGGAPGLMVLFSESSNVPPIHKQQPPGPSSLYFLPAGFHGPPAHLEDAATYDLAVDRDVVLVSTVERTDHSPSLSVPRCHTRERQPARPGPQRGDHRTGGLTWIFHSSIQGRWKAILHWSKKRRPVDETERLDWKPRISDYRIN